MEGEEEKKNVSFCSTSRFCLIHFYLANMSIYWGIFDHVVLHSLNADKTAAEKMSAVL